MERRLMSVKIEIHNENYCGMYRYVDLHIKQYGREIFYIIVSTLGVLQMNLRWKGKDKYLVVGMRTGQPLYFGDEPLFTG